VAEPTPRRRRRTRREADEPRPVSPSDFANGAAGTVAPGTAVTEVEDELAGERGLRGLIGGGSSQVSVGAALRARDATRPTPADVAAAEANLIIIRRGWTPPAGS
jgi:hypothetical protein